MVEVTEKIIQDTIDKKYPDKSQDEKAQLKKILFNLLLITDARRSAAILADRTSNKYKAIK